MEMFSVNDPADLTVNPADLLTSMSKTIPILP